MGVVQTIDNASNVWGGIDFAHLPRKDLLSLRLNGKRTAAFQVVIRQSALNRIHVHGDASPRVEICGVLVGDVYRDDTGAYLLVEHIIEGAASTGSAGQVTFTADTWQHIQVLMDKQFPDKRIVGWYHTHPGHGIFLSEMDVFLHESFFGLPWQVALVYDPRSGDEGIFGTEAGHSKPVGFLVDADDPAAPKLAQAGKLPLATAPAAAPRRPATPIVFTRVRRRRAPVGRALLAVIALGLFAIMGVLLGVLIRMQHLHMPDWILRMSRP
jgi:proteasome lid subunit RPN8/RPN11